MFNENEVVTNYIQRWDTTLPRNDPWLFFFSTKGTAGTNALLLLSLTKNVLLASLVFPPKKEGGRGGKKIPSRWVPLFIVVVPKLRVFARMTSSFFFFFFPSTQTRINIGLFSGTSAIDPPGLGKASLPRSTARFHLFSLPSGTFFFFFFPF